MSEISEIRELGETAYGGYCQASGGKSLVSGASLPLWDEQAPEIRQAWNLAAMAVVCRWQQAGEDAPGSEPQQAARYALVEQLGHRSTVGTVREVTFCGKQALEVTDLKAGSVHVVFPDSLYGVTWLAEDDARTRVRPWTAVALPAANPNPWGDYGADDYPDEAERADVLRMRREMAREAGDDFAGRPRDSMEDGE